MATGSILMVWLVSTLHLAHTPKKIISDAFYGINDFLCVICTWCVVQIEFDDSQYKTLSSLSKCVECLSLKIGAKNV